MPQSVKRTGRKPSDHSYPKETLKKAQGIKALIFDVDGVLTDGRIIYSDKGDEWKEFHVRDGLIIGHLKKAGFVVGILSGRESSAVTRRATELRLDFCHQGLEDKSWACQRIMDHHKLKAKEVAYIGDDVNDFGVFEMVGLSICPSDAPVYVREKVSLVTAAKGGRGVLREAADLILMSQGKFEKVLKSK